MLLLVGLNTNLYACGETDDSDRGAPTEEAPATPPAAPVESGGSGGVQQP